MDITKGVLVVCMVIYHSLNYTSEYFLAFKYLSFLPSSFIFISGFLISNIYSARCEASDWRPCRRLMIRGGKLLILFTVLNVASHLIRKTNYNGQAMGVGDFFGHAWEVYVLGSGRVAVFEVLLPIAYLMIISPLLIRANSRQRYIVPLIAFSLLVLCATLDRRGYALGNLNLMSIGVLGMVVGRVSIQSLNILGRYWLIIFLVYCIYFPLGVAKGPVFLVQVLGAMVTLAMIYSLGLKIGNSGSPAKQLILLGKYSLVSYILQIGILQLLFRAVGRPEPFSWGSCILFFGTLVFMTVAIRLLDWAQTRSTVIARLYKSVFA